MSPKLQLQRRTANASLAIITPKNKVWPWFYHIFNAIWWVSLCLLPRVQIVVGPKETGSHMFLDIFLHQTLTYSVLVIARGKYSPASWSPTYKFPCLVIHNSMFYIFLDIYIDSNPLKVRPTSISPLWLHYAVDISLNSRSTYVACLLPLLSIGLCSARSQTYLLLSQKFL